MDTTKALITLRSHSTYYGSIIIYDTTGHPWKNISTEINRQGNFHLFFYQPTPVKSINPGTGSADIPGTETNALAAPLNLAISRTDLDANNPPLPIGLQTKAITTDSSLGHLRIVLRHQPNEKNGTYAPGSTDLDVSFRVSIRN